MLLKSRAGKEGAVEIGRKKRARQDEDEEESIKDGSSEPNSSEVPDNCVESPSFLPEKAALYQQRFEEGYDVNDPEYTFWLRVNHPDALPEESSIVQFFPDTPVLTPLDQILDDLESSFSVLAPETPCRRVGLEYTST